MIKRIINSLIIKILLLSSLAYAETGNLFQLTQSGPAASIDVILCLNGKGPLSCQTYHVAAENLQIKTTINHHYPFVGIKVLTPGYHPTLCTPYSNGYCLFTANGTTSTAISLIPNGQKQNQTITFTSTPPLNPTVGTTYTVSASASSGLPVSITVDSSSSSVCSISGSTVTFNDTGTCTLDANQAGNIQYNAAPQVQQSMTVGKDSQTITFTSTAPTNPAIGDTYNVSATASSGLTVTITVNASSSSVCSISGSTVTFNAGGTCTLDANQAGNAQYNAAPQVQQNINVGNKQSQTITFTSTAPTNAVVGNTYTVSASASSSLTVTITVDAGSSSVCSISGSTVLFNTAGTCTLDANQAGDSQYNPAPQVQQSITVSLATSTLVSSSLNPSTTSDTVTLNAQVRAVLGSPTAGTVSFSANSSPISGCTAQSLSSGVATCTTSSLNTGAIYSIVATYSGTSGYASSSSPTFNQYVAASAPPATVPSAPTYVTAVAGNGQVTVNWLPPSDTGGDTTSLITYTVTYWDTSTPASPTTVGSCTAISALTCTVTGLSNGTAYTFGVTATNSEGVAPYLLGYSGSVTPENELVFNSPSLALFVSGNVRNIQLTNTLGSNITNLSVSFPGSWTGSGTPLGTSNCPSTLSAGASCYIAVNPGSSATSACTSGLAPTPDQITVNYGIASSVSIPVVVLSYGCQYQGGYLFAIDDTTPITGSIGGKVLTAANQATSVVWGPFPGTVWGATQSSTVVAPSTAGLSSPVVGQLNCNGNTDGACTSNNIWVTGASNYPGANSCLSTIDASGASCVSGATCYTGWYLPAICEMGYTISYQSDCGANPGILPNIQHNLVDVPGMDIAGLGTVGTYWSSTIAVYNLCTQEGYCAWYQNFNTKLEFGDATFVTEGARCVRGLTY